MLTHQHAIDAELTFAGLHAFRPFVINILAAKSSTIIEPSTTRSATTHSTRFLEHSTLWTRYVSAIVDMLNDMLAGVEIDLLAMRSRLGA